MNNRITVFCNQDSELILKQICENILEVQKEVSREVESFFENNGGDYENIDELYKSIFADAVSIHKKIGGNFSDCVKKSQKKYIRKGFSIEEIQLSRLIYLSGLAAGYIAESNISEAMRLLSITNKYLGEYRSVTSWGDFFGYRVSDVNQDSFRRDTLLKILYGMSKHAFKCELKNIERCSILIFDSLVENKINIDCEDIKKYLLEAHSCEASWNDSDYKNSGIISKEDQERMLLIILGISIDKFHYDPNKKINKATGEKQGSIFVSIDGIVSSDTIKNVLRIAKRVFESQSM